MQDSINNMQISMSNLSFKQQRKLAEAQIDAALTGQELTNDQQRASSITEIFQVLKIDM